ncbi:diguanylate cyclase [Alteromonadaceae bacterium BrNp21-10]|nr:diguanylate cyclase [Alteromonadaceae bacterium BrNp21-10]
MSKPTILIVDDEPTNIQVLASCIVDDYQLKIANSGASALEVLDKGQAPDLILLDVIMPEMDGYETFKRIREKTDHANIPIIFISALNAVEDEAKGLELGASDYIHKPFHSGIVRARIKTHIDLKLKTDMLEHASLTDFLTGLPNRRAFDKHLDREWQYFRRRRLPLSLIMIDVDYFKAYNDTYGHMQGDEALKQIGNALQSCINRSHDVVARYGGEEFIAVFPETDISAAKHLASLFQQRIFAANIAHSASQVSDRVTISCGLVEVNDRDHYEDYQALLQEADEALYEAKAKGRNCIVSYRDIGVTAE